MNEVCVPGDSRHGSLATFSELVWFFGFLVFFLFFCFPEAFWLRSKKPRENQKNQKNNLVFLVFPRLLGSGGFRPLGCAFRLGERSTLCKALVSPRRNKRFAVPLTTKVHLPIGV